MEKEETATQGSMKNLECLVKRLKDALDQFLNGAHSAQAACFDISCVNHILSDLQKLFLISDEEAKKEYATYIGSLPGILNVWYKFQSWQYNSKF